MTGGTTCLVCASLMCLLIDVPYPFVRQSDFTNVKLSGRVGACQSCSALFHCVDQEDVRRIETQFADKAYARREQTSQTVPLGSGDRFATWCALQAEMLRSSLSAPPRAILDIGCYDGELLAALQRRFPGAALHGFDVAEQMAEDFPKRHPFRFWSRRLDDIPGNFDLICISHTLMYLRDLAALISDIDRLLAPGGQLFLQMPDIEANPLLLLMGDQYHYFTPTSLAGTLGRFGFKTMPVDNPWFPREVVALAWQQEGGPTAADHHDTGYGASGVRIQERFAREYRCRTVVI